MPTKDPDKLREKWRRNKATQRARLREETQDEDEGTGDFWNG